MFLLEFYKKVIGFVNHSYKMIELIYHSNTSHEQYYHQPSSNITDDEEMSMYLCDYMEYFQLFGNRRSFLINRLKM